MLGWKTNAMIVSIFPDEKGTESSVACAVVRPKGGKTVSWAGFAALTKTTPRNTYIHDARFPTRGGEF